MNFVSFDKVVYHPYGCDIFWFREGDKIFRCKGKKVFVGRKWLLKFDDKHVLKYVHNSCCEDSMVMARSLGVPVLHPRKIYANYKW